MRNNRRSEAGRSASISSTRPIRDDRGAFSEDEEDEIEQREAEEVGADGGVEADRNSPDTPSEGAIVDEALSESGSLDPVTLRERQSLINVEHPFGLPIWKPALYKKSRSVTRNAETALHSVPSASAEKHFLPGNLVWVLMFGWWLAAIIIVTSAVLYVAEFISRFGAHTYSTLVYGLGWYVFWPFGNYLEGDLLEGEDPPVKRNSLAEEVEPEEDEEGQRRERGGSSGSGGTVRGVSPPTSPPLGPSPVTDERRAVPLTSQSTITPRSVAISSQHQHVQSSSWNSTGAQPPDTIPPTERTSLLSDGSARAPLPTSIKFYGTTTSEASPIVRAIPQDIPFFASLSYWLILILVIAPIMLTVTILCWGLVVTIPMAKLNWALLKFLFLRPLSVRFRAAPLNVIVQSSTPFNVANGEPGEATEDNTRTFTFKSPRLRAGQAAPTRKGTGGSDSTVLLCIYRATGSQYYKYTVGGVNILFINLLPIVFFAIFDGFFLLPIVEHRKEHGRPVTPLLSFIAHRATIFILSLSSVIPLSYFIGMAVASISAQSSIGMGAVINATFGSVIEILLYAIALTRGKGRLVEGSIVGSILAGVLLMPGASMCSGALKKKEQKFNAKSAGVTSTMLIMAIIGVLTPTLFYQTYGNVSHKSQREDQILIPAIVSSNSFAKVVRTCRQDFLATTGCANTVITRILIPRRIRSIKQL
jgi:Ca2+:H+ antiporter